MIWRKKRGHMEMRLEFMGDYNDEKDKDDFTKIMHAEMAYAALQKARDSIRDLKNRHFKDDCFDLYCEEEDIEPKEKTIDDYESIFGEVEYVLNEIMMETDIPGNIF